MTTKEIIEADLVVLDVLFQQLEDYAVRYTELASNPSLEDFEEIKVSLTSVIGSLVDYKIKYKNYVDASYNRVKYVKAKFFQDSVHNATKTKTILDCAPSVVKVVRQYQDFSALYEHVKEKLNWGYELWSKILQSVSVSGKSLYAQKRST